MLAHIGTCLDPALNLALEEQLCLSLPEGHPGWFLLWQNGPSVIVGRHQCTMDEVNMPFVTARNIPVVRRMTGGGAVYHDTGNLNFSLISHAGAITDGGRLDFGRFLGPVVAALARLGVDARLSGRNDLEVDGRKISGSGQRVWRGRVLHHGTLLVRADVDTMMAVLTPDEAKIRAKGVASVRSRVTNIADHWRRGTTLDDLRRELVAACADGQGTPSAEDMAAATALAETKYRRWDWNFGASPPYTEERKQRFPWGTVRVRLDVARGVVRHCRIEGDFFATGDVATLETRLTGCSREPQAMKQVLAGIRWHEWFSGYNGEDVAALFV